MDVTMLSDKVNFYITEIKSDLSMKTSEEVIHIFKRVYDDIHDEKSPGPLTPPNFLFNKE